MTYIAASREALERALRSCRVEDGSPAPLFREGDLTHIAYRLIASGAVIDAATLADDEAGLATVLAKRHKCLDHNGPGSGPCRTDRERAALIAQWIRDRAAALTERTR